MRRVGEVQRFLPELHLVSFSKGELTEDAQVPIEYSWSAERVESRSPEASRRYWREWQRIEIRGTGL